MPVAYGAHFLFCYLKTKGTIAADPQEATRPPSRPPTPYDFSPGEGFDRTRRGGRRVARGSGDEIEIVTYSRVPFVNPPAEGAITSSPSLCLDSFLLLFRPVTSFRAAARGSSGVREKKKKGLADRGWRRERKGGKSQRGFALRYMDIGTFTKAWLSFFCSFSGGNYACGDLGITHAVRMLARRVGHYKLDRPVVGIIIAR